MPDSRLLAEYYRDHKLLQKTWCLLPTYYGNQVPQLGINGQKAEEIRRSHDKTFELKPTGKVSVIWTFNSGKITS